MRLIVSSHQITYFQENGWIEFEGFLSLEECKRARLSCKMILEERTKIPVEKWITSPTTPLFEAGRDAFLEDDFLRKITLRRKMGEIACTLSREKGLRLGFEQIIYTNQNSSPFFEGVTCLQELSSIQKLEMGLLLRLSFSKSPSPIMENKIPLSPLPEKQGNAIFLHPEKPLDFQPLLAQEAQYFLLIGYASTNARFVEKEKDPFSKNFKKQHYSAGDLLKEPFHPIVYQQQNEWI